MGWKKPTMILAVFVWLVTGCCDVWKQRGRICSYDLRQGLLDREVIHNRVVFATGEYFNLVMGGRVRAVRNPGGAPAAWSPDGKALLLKVPEPGSTPLYHLAVVREPDWSQMEYVQKNIYGFGEADWGPDEDWIVFIGIPDYYTIKTEKLLGDGIYVLNLRSGEKRLVGGGACHPEWSPDGKMIAVVTYIEELEIYGLRIIDLGEHWAEGGWAGLAGERVVYRFSTKCSGAMASWFPDSRRLLVSDGLKILLLNLDDGSTETVYEIDTPRAEGYLRARVLPGGRHVVYQANYRDGWCRDDGDCWRRESGRIRTSSCGSDSRCWHREIMLADLEEMVWRDITPKVEGYDHPAYYSDLEFEWWQER